MTRTKALPRGWTKERVEKARKDLLVLLEPSPSNICYNDGYYAASLVREYGMSVSELQGIVGTPKFKTTIRWE